MKEVWSVSKELLELSHLGTLATWMKMQYLGRKLIFGTEIRGKGIYLKCTTKQGIAE